MNPEERSLLERTYKLAEENNDILRSMRRMSRVGAAFRVFYWVVIIGLSIGAFYFIQPYIEFLTSLLGVQGSTAAGINLPQDQLTALQELLK